MTPDPRLAATTLRALAEKASPLTWGWATSCSYRRMPGIMDPVVHVDGQADIAVSEEDMAFIEAASPDAILAILDAAKDERDALAARLAGAERVIAAVRAPDTDATWYRNLGAALRAYDEAGGEGRGTV